jgi:hypothetical protein
MPEGEWSRGETRSEYFGKLDVLEGIGASIGINWLMACPCSD